MKKIILLTALTIGMANVVCAQQPAQRQSDPKAPKVEAPEATMTHSSCKNAHRCPHAQRTCQHQQRVSAQTQTDSVARVNNQNTQQQSNAVGKPRKPRKTSK